MAMRKSALAVLLCAVFVMVFAAPLAQSQTGDIHTIVKDENGPPSTCALDWVFSATEDGVWTGHVLNGGMRWVIFDVVDDDLGDVLVDRDMYRFAVYTDEFDTEPVSMVADHNYRITVTPNGPLGSSCTVEDVFVPDVVANEPPVADFSVSVDGDTVFVDASASDDSDGTIVSYEWTWGDGTTETGMTASHTYILPTKRAPPAPYVMFGYTYASDGTTPLAGCDVTITDVTSGLFWETVSSATGQYYFVIEAADGDTIHVEAVKGDLYGDATGIASGGSMMLNVILEGETPPEPVPMDVTITLTVTDDDGAIGTLSKTVTVYITPTA